MTRTVQRAFFALFALLLLAACERAPTLPGSARTMSSSPLATA